MFLMPSRHMLLCAANIFVAAADLGIGGHFTQLASTAINYSHIVSTVMLFREQIQKKNPSYDKSNVLRKKDASQN